jgi:hypothetical protein
MIGFCYVPATYRKGSNSILLGENTSHFRTAQQRSLLLNQPTGRLAP